jgi:hypothetical protein
MDESWAKLVHNLKAQSMSIDSCSVKEVQQGWMLTKINYCRRSTFM